MSMRTIPLRQVPGDSVIHRLWAGTKLIIVLLLGVLTWVLPSWPGLGFVAGTVLITALIAGIPIGAVPRPPWWFWALIVVGGLINLTVGLSALEVYLRATLLGLVVVASSILVIWTTPLAEVAPALAVLMRPLRWLRMPVDEWAVSIALCLRGLPLLLEELRIMRAAHRLRSSGSSGSSDKRRSKQRGSAQMGIVDVVTAAMSSALRRSAEMAEAITARGGTGRLTAYPSRPHRRDAVALAVFLTAGTAAVVASLLL